MQIKSLSFVVVFVAFAVFLSSAVVAENPPSMVSSYDDENGIGCFKASETNCAGCCEKLGHKSSKMTVVGTCHCTN